MLSLAMPALLHRCAVTARVLSEAALGFLYPEVCQLCGTERATAEKGFLGPQCWQQVRFVVAPYCQRCGLPLDGEITTPFECANCREMELHFSTARAAVAARGLVLEVIHRYKYQGALWFEPFLAGLLCDRAGPALRAERWDWIVPVPLHPVREAEREFNQAVQLGRRLSAATGIPLYPNLLRRVAPTHTQTRLSRAERAANVRRAFLLADQVLLEGRRLVLVDDVLTTGATTSACAGVLRKAGASEVCVWTVARGLLK
jgi:ComF family protein